MTTADGQAPKGPHLVDIGKRYKPDELVESILKPSAKLAQGYESYTFAMVDGTVVTGFVVSEAADEPALERTTSPPLERPTSPPLEELDPKREAPRAAQPAEASAPPGATPFGQ